MSGMMGNTAGGAFRAAQSSLATPPAQCQPPTDRLLDGIIRQVFKEDLQRYQGGHPDGQCLDGITSHLPDYGSVQCLLSVILEDRARHPHQTSLVPPWSSDGRLGPPTTHFDSKSVVGSFTSGLDRLVLNSQDNFSTIRANVCVYKGRWQYELMLGTKGVMQVGWSTLGCKFSEEKGVGDTQDSYAYDGNRQRKWNVATFKYGAMWQSGDVISCTLDLEEGKVEFYRNGKSLGPAFTTVKTGPGYAYFPAMSLAIGESLAANFGATPFRYPQAGFAPLEAPPTQDLIRADCCVTWLTRLVHMSRSWPQQEDPHTSSRHRTCLLIVVQHIAAHLGPLLARPYVVEACLVPALARVAQVTLDQPSPTLALEPAHTLIDFLIASLETTELQRCLENLIVCLLTGHKQAAEDVRFRGQKYNLRLLYTLLSHPRLRKICLTHILFDKVQFPSFVNIKAVDEEGLSAVVGSAWWASKDSAVTSGGDKLAYEASCRVILRAVQEVEDIQVSILRLLLSASDAQRYEDTSRALFLSKFRTFLREHAPGSRVPIQRYTPLPVILCLFHRLLTIFEELWKEEEAPGSSVYIPPRLFYDGALNYFDTHRLGGLESHLLKTFRKELCKALPSIHPSDETKVILKINNATAGTSNVTSMDLGHSQPSTSGALLGSLPGDSAIKTNLHRVTVTQAPDDNEKSRQQGGGSGRGRDSLLHLLDGIVLLYHIGAHKQLGKVAAQRDSMNDNITHVGDIDRKIEYCNKKGSNPALLEELSGSRRVFVEKLEEQARQQAWVLAAVHSPQKYSHLTGLMRVILETLKAASSEGELFAFVPDFYVDSLTELCTAMRLYFTTPPENATSTQTLLTDVGEFLALHFCDTRIVYADSKDSLIQALAGFVCHQPTLAALEAMPEESRRQMVRNLLQPYENRAWAQNNWILVRFWKGCGFGFRYTKSPHMTNKFGPKPPNADNSNFTQATAPCPSPTFQRHVVEVLESSTEISTPFLNSLLNQLNWAFSEFIGMLQEIQNASNRPERVFIDSRQLRICATCFDLALALLRVLEMIVSVAPQLFTDFSRPNAKFLLSRLCQLLCQVLNRVSGWSGCFGHVVSLEIPGLETIHHYPILTAVTGILVTLISHDLEQACTKSQVATRTLITEPSFQLSSIHQLLGNQESGGTSGGASGDGNNTVGSGWGGEQGQINSPSSSSSSSSPPTSTTTSNNGSVSGGSTSPPNKFSLKKYPEHINACEVNQVERIASHLESCVKLKGEKSPGEDEDSLCTICYAYPASAIFRPCAHSSCRACVTQHLMNRTDCFFCKATIQEVLDQTTGTIVHQTQTSKDPSLKS